MNFGGRLEVMYNILEGKWTWAYQKRGPELGINLKESLDFLK